MVEYRSIGSLITRKTIRAKNITSPAFVYAITSNQGFIRSDDMHDFQIYSEDYSNYLAVEKNDFAYNPSRLNIGSIAFYKNDGYGLVSPMYVVFHPDETIILPEYLFNLIKSELVRNRIDALKEVGARFRFHFSRWKNIQIPVPSIEEQERIVRILDTFTAGIENVKKQLSLRRKQYEYYRDHLLNPASLPNAEIKTVLDVAEIYSGLTYKPDNISNNGTLVLRSSNIRNNKLSFEDNVFVCMDIPKRAIVKKDDILICVRNGSRKLIGKCAMITKEADGMAFGAFMSILRAHKINSKFLFYIWQCTNVRNQYKGDESMPITQITAKDFKHIIIPVPPKEEQENIVAILNQFETSIDNLEQQLTLREKQYEYYRNKLLTF